MNKLKRTPLYNVHKESGGRIVEFAGWEMPVQYAGVLAEHRTVRTKAGLFDVSHMGEIFVTGRRALDFCQLISTNDASKLNIGDVQYSCYCMPDGGIVDDFTLFRMGPEKFLFIVNASNKDKDLKWMIDHQIAGAKIEDQSDKYSLIALQGPKSEGILSQLVDLDLSRIKFYGFEMSKFGKSELMVSRTGYTGEDGFELMIENDGAVELWNSLLKAGVDEGIAPIGLGARDTLRMEMGYALYGHDISDTTNPLEAGLGWIVKLNKPQFLGKETLLAKKEKGFSNRFTGFTLTDKGVPRDKYRIFKDGRPVGVVTSGTYSPSLDIGIGLCYIEKGILEGTEIELEIRERKVKAVLKKPPFVKGSVKK
jgi:aminomethyltransferase